MGTHLLSFMVFQRTGVRLFFGDAHFRKYVENRFAFYFQLPGQIVDSNLTHPLFLSSAYPLSLHINLTELFSRSTRVMADVRQWNYCSFSSSPTVSFLPAFSPDSSARVSPDWSA